MPPTKERKVEKTNLNTVEEDTGPFIFSPFTSLNTANKVTGKQGQLFLILILIILY